MGSCILFCFVNWVEISKEKYDCVLRVANSEPDYKYKNISYVFTIYWSFAIILQYNIIFSYERKLYNKWMSILLYIYILYNVNEKKKKIHLQTNNYEHNFFKITQWCLLVLAFTLFLSLSSIWNYFLLFSLYRKKWI